MKSKIEIEIDNKELKLTTEYRYLGLLLDDELTFAKHIKVMKQQISFRHYTLRVLKKVRWCKGYKDAMTIYKSMIMPMFDIGDIYYQSANTKRTTNPPK